jgi:hypothetical protein
MQVARAIDRFDRGVERYGVEQTDITVGYREHQRHYLSEDFGR